jgi:hypothetical protein
VIEVNADLWTVAADVRCVTTNGTVTSDGRNVMGGGCAREAADRYPLLAHLYGDLITACGNHVFLVHASPAVALVMFPVKHEVQLRAEVSLIERSAHELIALADVYGWERIALPRPGSGLGGLSWDDDVRPALEPWLDDRFVLIDFPVAVA